MPSLSDGANGEPCAPDLGTLEEWARIEQALGYKGVDPQRRGRLWRDLRQIFSLYFGVRVPVVRSPDVRRALAVLRDHATAIQACLPLGRQTQSEPGESHEAWLRRELAELAQREEPENGLDGLVGWAMALVGFDILPAQKQQVLWEGVGRVD